MNNAVTALIWETWRLSRRWYLWVLPVAFGLDFLVMRQVSRIAARAPPGFNSAAELAVLIVPSALMINFSLAIFATLLAISLGNKAGFPLSFEFRLPVKTSVLVAVPMLTLAALCASLYIVPMLVVRLVYDVPVPLLPAGALIASLVIILLACGWSTASTESRTFAMLVGVIVASQLFGVLDPVDLSNRSFVPGQPPVFNRNVIALGSGEYAVLTGFGLILYALATASIRKLRHGEAPVLQLPGVEVSKPKPRKASVWLRTVLNRASDALMPSCPTGSPWRAELWLEARRQVLPILLLSVLIAACVPLLYLLGVTPTGLFGRADYVFPGAVFFVGIGMAIFNRRQSSSGYMSAFEGTRGMSTLALASIQMLAVVAAAFCGIALVLVSVHFASGLVAEPGNLALRIQGVLSSLKQQPPLLLLSTAITQLVTFVTWVMLLACIHTWSVIWGRWIPYGAGMLTIYAAAQVISVQSGNATLEDIGQHLWAIAIALLVLTVLAFARTLYTKVLSLRVSAAALVVWGVFLACSFYAMTQEGITFTALAPEMQAFRGALLLSPLLFFVLLLWSYDRLRHR